MPVFVYLITVIGAYLIGSIPFGFLVAKARGIDIRSVGSGNIGATNAMRVLGRPAGIFVLLMDALKGFTAAKWLPLLVLNISHIVGSGGTGTLPILAGIGAVLGHNYTCWLKFKGGKGIATTAGVYLALAPWAVLAGLAVFLLAVLITKYVSVGSMAAAVALTLTVWIMSPHDIFLGLVTTALAAMAIYKHKSNLQRLLAGTENRVGKKSATAGGAK